MTEKDYNPEQRNAKAMKKQAVSKKVETAPIKKVEKKTENKTETKKQDSKKVKQPVKIIKKNEAFVNGRSLPISTKQSMAICKFIKGKTIEKAMADLNEVLILRKAVPMKGEIPHRKGNIMSGRYPINASKAFIQLMKTLKGNANVNGLENPIIVEAISNLAQRPFGRGGIRRKRTHVKIIVKEKTKLKNKKVGGNK